jgi:hypothetical protein
VLLCRYIEFGAKIAIRLRHLNTRVPPTSSPHSDALTLLELDYECATLHSVDQDVSTLEQSIARPSTHKVYGASTSLVVVLGIDVEEANFLDTSTSRVVRNRSHIQDAEAGAIVGLVCKSIRDVLVVINTFSSRLVDTGLLRCLERRDVPNIRDRVAGCTWTDLVVLIVLVVEEEILLVFGIENYALMCVCGTFIRSDGENDRGLLISYVVDSQGVLVVAIANFAAFKLLIRPMIDETLRIMDIAVLRCTSEMLATRIAKRLDCTLTIQGL